MQMNFLEYQTVFRLEKVDYSPKVRFSYPKNVANILIQSQLNDENLMEEVLKKGIIL